MKMKIERARPTRGVRALHQAGILASLAAGIVALPNAAFAAAPLIAGQFIGQAAAVVTQANGKAQCILQGDHDVQAVHLYMPAFCSRLFVENDVPDRTELFPSHAEASAASF